VANATLDRPTVSQARRLLMLYYLIGDGD
jgi:hypothetical protein